MVATYREYVLLTVVFGLSVAYYLEIMTESYEFIPDDPTPDGGFYDMVDELIGGLSLSGQALDMAVQDFEGSTDAFDEFLVEMYTLSGDVEELQSKAMQIITDLGGLIDKLVGEKVGEVASSGNYVVAKTIAVATSDRGRLLQAISGRDLFINLTEDEIIRGSLASLAAMQASGAYEGLAESAKMLFGRLLDDQLCQLEGIPAPMSAPPRMPLSYKIVQMLYDHRLLG